MSSSGNFSDGNKHHPSNEAGDYCTSCYIWILIGYVLLFCILIGSFVVFDYLQRKHDRRQQDLLQIKSQVGPKGNEQTPQQSMEQSEKSQTISKQ